VQTSVESQLSRERERRSDGGCALRRRRRRRRRHRHRRGMSAAPRTRVVCVRARTVRRRSSRRDRENVGRALCQRGARSRAFLCRILHGCSLPRGIGGGGRRLRTRVRGSGGGGGATTAGMKNNNNKKKKSRYNRFREQRRSENRAPEYNIIIRRSIIMEVNG